MTGDSSVQLGAPPAGLVPGSRVAGYLLERQVGTGGTATVLRARDERLGRVVALKLLAVDLTKDEAFRRRFLREARAVAAVDHPHIIPVHEAGQADGVLFIAMRSARRAARWSTATRSRPARRCRCATATASISAPGP